MKSVHEQILIQIHNKLTVFLVNSYRDNVDTKVFLEVQLNRQISFQTKHNILL